MSDSGLLFLSAKDMNELNGHAESTTDEFKLSNQESWPSDPTYTHGTLFSDRRCRPCQTNQQETES